MASGGNGRFVKSCSALILCSFTCTSKWIPVTSTPCSRRCNSRRGASCLSLAATAELSHTTTRVPDLRSPTRLAEASKGGVASKSCTCRSLRRRALSVSAWRLLDLAITSPIFWTGTGGCREGDDEYYPDFAAAGESADDHA